MTDPLTKFDEAVTVALDDQFIDRMLRDGRGSAFKVSAAAIHQAALALVEAELKTLQEVNPPDVPPYRQEFAYLNALDRRLAEIRKEGGK